MSAEDPRHCAKHFTYLQSGSQIFSVTLWAQIFIPILQTQTKVDYVVTLLVGESEPEFGHRSVVPEYYRCSPDRPGCFRASDTYHSFIHLSNKHF